MKKVLLSMAVAVTALCGTAQITTETTWDFSTWTAGTIADGTVQENITFAGKWTIDTSKKTVDGVTYTQRLKSGGSKRTASIQVAGAGTFAFIGVTSSSSDLTRTATIAIDGTTIDTKTMDQANPVWYTVAVPNAGTLSLTTNAGINFYALKWTPNPTEPSLDSFTVGGEEMTIDNTAMTITGTVKADIDLATTAPVVVIGGSATSYNFDNNYNGGTLTVTDGTTTLTYTVTVTNREADTTMPTFTGIYCGDLDLMGENALCPVDGTIHMTFDEPIKFAESAEPMTLYGMSFTDFMGETENMTEDVFNVTAWIEGNSLYFKLAEPATRFNSDFMYMPMINGVISDIDGNVYYDNFGMGSIIRTETVPLTITDNTPAADEYVHALKFTFSTDIELLPEVEGQAPRIMLTAIDPNLGFPAPIETIESLEVYGNTLYVLDVAKAPNSFLMYGVGMNCVRSIYYDALVPDPDYADFCYVNAEEGIMLGSNEFRIGYNAPINDTYIMPSWISGTAGISVKRDYAGTDMTSGIVGAIRGGAADSLIIDLPEAADVVFSVSGTGSRTFVVTNDANEQLASVSVTKNTPTPIAVQVPAAGKIYLHTPGATGGFTVQGITINTYSGVKALNADKQINVRYANNVIVNNGAAVEVYNTMGVCVARSNGNIDMTAMPKGVYIVRTDKGSMKIAR